MAADAESEATPDPSALPTFARHAQETAGASIGPYTLLQTLGEGGFGTVYIARQERPVQRQVALKILKLGMDTKEVVARFEQERQALALMDHPHIARVLDAGATDTGRPYFVMELVKGEAITVFCDKHNLTIPERLELFAEVCAAVQHAHTKGIIHRDLKPSNVMVSTQDGRPFARVIDFGIAKALSGRLTEQTIFTERGRLIGTPEYMSPEQADGSLDVDTRSDVYSLGALLYELLSGTPPFDREQLRSAGYGEIQRIIREVEPPTPSARVTGAVATLATIAARRRTEPARLGHTLRGELDWIVMKAMEKDRQRRYETANGLAMDVRRYLAGDPVMAAPPSTAYRLRKFARRHRGGVVAGAAVAAALLLGLGLALWQAGVAARERDAARTAEAEARAVSEFQSAQLAGIDAAVMAQGLRKTLLSEAKAGLERSSVPAADVASRMQQLEELLLRANFTNVARTNLDEHMFGRALKAADEQFRDQPVVKAKLLHSIAASMGTLGLYERAAAPLKEAVAIRRQWLGSGADDTLDSLQQLGAVLVETGAYKEGEALHREALAASRARGADRPVTFLIMSELAGALKGQGRFAEAEHESREAYEGLRRVAGDADERTLQLRNRLGLSLSDRGNLIEAEKHHRAVVERQRLAPHPGADTVNPLNNLAAALSRLGRLAEAETFAREAWERRRQSVGDDHPSTLTHATVLGTILADRGEVAEAESLARHVLDRAHRTLGPEDRRTAEATFLLGRVFLARGQLADAERTFRELFEERRRIDGEDHPETLLPQSRLGQVLATMGRFPEAESVDRDLVERQRRVLGVDHPETIMVTNNLAFALMRQGKFAEAEPFYREATAAQERQFGRDNSLVGVYRMGIARALMGQGRFEEAEPLMIEAERVLAVAETPRGAHQRSLEVLVELYDSWEKANPGNGHGSRARQWKAKLRPAAS